MKKSVFSGPVDDGNFVGAWHKDIQIYQEEISPRERIYIVKRK
jgi:hypothetical protein